MKITQYTIRAIPPKLDQRLRSKARRSGKSLNTVVLETLVKAEGLTAAKPVYNDLDWLIGKGELDRKNFDQAMGWLDSLPREIR
jgi:hypothetical protein